MQGNEKSAGKSQKKSWFQGLQSEFKKIVWTDRNELIKQTIVVVCVSIVLCVLISVMDSFILEGINLLMNKDKVIVCQKRNGMLFILIPGMRTK